MKTEILRVELPAESMNYWRQRAELMGFASLQEFWERIMLIRDSEAFLIFGGNGHLRLEIIPQKRENKA